MFITFQASRYMVLHSFELLLVNIEGIIINITLSYVNAMNTIYQMYILYSFKVADVK